MSAGVRHYLRAHRYLLMNASHLSSYPKDHGRSKKASSASAFPESRTDDGRPTKHGRMRSGERFGRSMHQKKTHQHISHTRENKTSAFHESAQTPSSFNLGAHPRGEGRVRGHSMSLQARVRSLHISGVESTGDGDRRTGGQGKLRCHSRFPATADKTNDDHSRSSAKERPPQPHCTSA